MTDRMDVAVALQRRVFALLTAALGGVPIFDNVPEDKAGPYPFVAIGDDQVIADPAEGLEDSVEIRSTIHVYSNKVGRLENKALCRRVVTALTAADLDLGPDWTAVLLLPTGTHVIEDEDGVTTHGLVTFKILADAA